MTDVRKLLARLNPRVAQYEVGSGGLPELTPQDIAGALGTIREPLGRELLCHVWWPDGALRSRAQLLDAMRDRQLQEWVRRMRNLEAAHLAYHLACELADGTHGRMHGQISRARSEVEDAKGQMWPRIGPQSRYRAIRDGVLAEMLAMHLCPGCGGTGESRIDAIVRVCVRCTGSGHAKVSDSDRAERLGCTRKTYTEAWANPYEWLFAECAQAERRAAWHMARELEIAG